MKNDNKQNKKTKVEPVNTGQDDQINILRNQLARALADYDNLRKRTETEKEILGKTASFKIVLRLLPILDMLEDAQKHLADQGLAIALGEFKKILAEENLEEITVQPEDIFDEQLHEAVEMVDGGSEGMIADMVLSGWKYKDGPVIRHTKVKVYKGLQN